MNDTDMGKRRITRKWAWILQSTALLILGIGICLIFILSDDERFNHVMRGEEYNSTAEFGDMFYSDVEKAIRYTELADNLETDGKLNYQTYIAEMVVSENVITCFTLQDAVDYGESLGLYFDEENNLVTQEGKPSWRQQSRDVSRVVVDMANQIMRSEGLVNHLKSAKEISDEDIGAGDEKSEAYEELEEFTGYYTGDLDKEFQEERKFLLKMLYQLAEYYELRKYLGVDVEEDATNFAYRFVYLNNDNKIVVAGNQMNSGSVQDILNLGYYFWMNSERDNLTHTFYDDMVSDVRKAMNEGGLLKGETHEIAAGVNLEFPVQDQYALGNHKYQQYRWMVYGSAAVICMGIIAAAAALFLLLRTGAEAESVLDTWYTEAALFILAAELFMLGAACVGIIDSFRDHDVPTLCTGIFFAVLMYYPVVIGICSFKRRWNKGDFFDRSLGIWAGREMLNSYQNVLRGQFSVFWVIVGYILVNVIFAGGLALVLEDIIFRNGRGFIRILVLVVCLVGILLANGAIFIYAGRRVSQGRRITDALNAISGGAIDTKIDTDGMMGQDKEMAEAINTIGDGLMKAVEAKTSSERMKTDLIANVSHDLRTPLTSIINYVDLLKRENLPNQKAREYLKILENKSLRMKQLAEDLVDASKVSSGNMTVNWNRIDLVQMVNQMEGEYQERLEAAELIPVTDLIAPPVYIQADGRLLFRVLENLYNNVCKYAMRGTRVYIDLRETSHKVVFTMKNISREPLNITADELTGRFVRGDASRTTEGSGLGLSIAQSITELMNGTFEIYLEGDLFRVRLIFPLDETEPSEI